MFLGHFQCSAFSSVSVPFPSPTFYVPGRYMTACLPVVAGGIGYLPLFLPGHASCSLTAAAPACTACLLPPGAMPSHACHCLPQQPPAHCCTLLLSPCTSLCSLHHTTPLYFAHALLFLSTTCYLEVVVDRTCGMRMVMI